MQLRLRDCLICADDLAYRAARLALGCRARIVAVAIVGSAYELFRQNSVKTYDTVDGVGCQSGERLEYHVHAYLVSERCACRAMGFPRSTQRSCSLAAPQGELRLRLKELAAVRVRYGYRRLHVLLRREGWTVNAKRIYRLYKEEGLEIRQKTPRRKRSCRYRGERAEISAPNQTWAMDFMSDRLFDGRPYRILTIVDCHSRESLGIEPRGSFRAFHVAEVLDRLARERGRPKTIRCDNGPEFAGRVLDQWAFFNQVELDFSRPATPTDNAYIESFNARLRQELLNASWFTSLADARASMGAWRKENNEDRPHTALQNRTPKEFIEEARAAARVA